MSVQFTRCLFVFPLPSIKESFDFERCFHCSIGEERVNEFIKKLSNAREKMAVSLNSNNLNAASVMNDIDDYTPLLWQLLDSLDRQEPVTIETPLRFVWKGSVISGYPKIDGIIYEDVIFDLIMTLHAKGLVTANLAAEIAESDPGAVNTAAKFLREASSIMTYLATTLIPRWQTKLKYRHIPLEANSQYCEFLSEFFSACSNQMCVAKALQNNSTKASLLSSLCYSVVKGMESCLNSLAQSGLPLKEMDSGSRIHAGVMREFFSALVYKYQADSFLQENETGIVIALCAVIQARIFAQAKLKHYDPFKPCEFPNEKSQSVELKSALKDLAESVAVMRSGAENDNKLVYFKKVPRDTSELPPLPKPTVLNLPCPPYMPPQSEVVMFSYDPSRKNTIFNRLSKMFFQPSSTPSDCVEKDDNNNDDKEDPTIESPDVVQTTNSVSEITINNDSNVQANDSTFVDENSVKRLTDMGFMDDVVRSTLVKHNGNETEAINDLLSSV